MTEDYQPRKLKRWTMPDSYFGEVWPDYYSSGFGRSRDSDHLEESNFAEAVKALGGESETVIIVRESHWAVGWVEWIAIHYTDAKALQIADGLRDQMESYPVLNEDDFCEREFNAACDAWSSASVRDRAGYIKRSRCGASIFAARRDHMPEEDNGSLQQLLIGC